MDRNVDVAHVAAKPFAREVNGFSEQWKVELSSRMLRTGTEAYRATCRPANFPINPTPLPPRGDCALPSSWAWAGVKPGPYFSAA